jgi:hypothetical protein
MAGSWISLHERKKLHKKSLLIRQEARRVEPLLSIFFARIAAGINSVKVNGRWGGEINDN